MSIKSKMTKFAVVTALGAFTLTAIGSMPALADPPRWSQGHHAQKHGHYHKKRHRRVIRRHIQPTRVIRQDVQPVQAGSISTSTGGTIIGAILGAVTGTQIGKGSGRTAAIIGGGILGAVIGGKIGQNMNDADRERSQNALETAPTGQTVSWQSPDAGNQYQVTPTKTYQTASGRHCRDYTTWVFIDGYEEQVEGTACRTSDGRWEEAS